jgi:hypothetical protein
LLEGGLGPGSLSQRLGADQADLVSFFGRTSGQRIRKGEFLSFKNRRKGLVRMKTKLAKVGTLHNAPEFRSLLSHRRSSVPFTTVPLLDMTST